MHTHHHYTYDPSTNLVRRVSNMNSATRHYQPVRTLSNRSQAQAYDGAGNQQYHDAQSGWLYHADGALAQLSWQAEGYQYQEYYTYAQPGVRARKVTEVRSLGSGVLMGLAIVNYLGEVEFRVTYEGTGLSYDGDKVIDANGAEVSPTSQRTITRIKDGHGQVGKLDKNELTGQQRLSYNALNHIDSNELALDEEGNLSHYRQYAPYGETVEEVKADDSNPNEIGYSGQALDDSGLVYYGHRYLQTKSGIWNRADPIRFASGQLNLYSMLAGNPVSGRDVGGLMKLSEFLEDVDGFSWDTGLKKIRYVLGDEHVMIELLSVVEDFKSKAKNPGNFKVDKKVLSDAFSAKAKEIELTEEEEAKLRRLFFPNVSPINGVGFVSEDYNDMNSDKSSESELDHKGLDKFDVSEATNQLEEKNALQPNTDYWLSSKDCSKRYLRVGKYLIDQHRRGVLFGLPGAKPPLPQALFKTQQIKLGFTSGKVIKANVWTPNVRFFSKKERDIVGNGERSGNRYTRRYKKKGDLFSSVSVGKMLEKLKETTTDTAVLGANDCFKWAGSLQRMIRTEYEENPWRIHISDQNPKLLDILTDKAPSLGVGDTMQHLFDSNNELGCKYHAATVVATSGAILITLEAHAGQDLTFPHFHIRKGVVGFARDNNTKYNSQGKPVGNYGFGSKVKIFPLMSEKKSTFNEANNMRIDFGKELLGIKAEEFEGGWIHNYAEIRFKEAIKGAFI